MIKNLGGSGFKVECFLPLGTVFKLVRKHVVIYARIPRFDKVGAIKEIRDTCGTSLADSRQIYEDFVAEHGEDILSDVAQKY